MSRIARLVVEGEEAVYHVTNRIVLEGFPLGDDEKDQLAGIILRLSKLYFVKILGFCIMGDHFHLIVRMMHDSHYSDDAIQNRYAKMRNTARTLSKSKRRAYRKKWASLSKFVGDIKQTFSCYFNKRHDRRGFLWADRFKSLIVEDGVALVSCMAYIDLNPVRAGIAECPDNYRWCSLGYHVQMKNKGGLLSLDFGLEAPRVMKQKEKLQKYREFVYEAGALKPLKGGKVKVISEIDIEEKHQTEFKNTREYRFLRRNRYFSDAGVIGSKTFVSKHYWRFKDHFMSKIEKKPKPIRGLTDIYAMKRLTE